MARAYIVLARNDLDDNLLQVLDLKPNSSQLSPVLDGQDSGQTGYQTFYLIDGVNTVVGALPAGPPITTPVTITYGLSAYILDNIENAVGTRACTAAQANNTAAAIEAVVAAGTALTAAVINAILVAQVGAGTSLTAGHSTGTVEQILRILAGERYRIPAATAIEDGVPDKVAAPVGGFVTTPNVELAQSVRTTYVWREGAVVTTDTNAPVRGRRSTSPLPYIRPGVPRTAAVQTGTQDTNFNNVRQVVETGQVHLSATDGVLADLKSATFTYLNPGFAYTAAAVTAARPRALIIPATVVPATGIARAVVIYDAAGNVI